MTFRGYKEKKDPNKGFSFGCHSEMLLLVTVHVTHGELEFLGVWGIKIREVKADVSNQNIKRNEQHC